MPLDHFSYAIDIKRFQNLLVTSVNDSERQKIQRLLAEEQAKTLLQDGSGKELK